MRHPFKNGDLLQHRASGEKCVVVDDGRLCGGYWGGDGVKVRTSLRTEAFIVNACELELAAKPAPKKAAARKTAKRTKARAEG